MTVTLLAEEAANSGGQWSYVATVIAAVLSSSGIWGVIQLVLQRRSRRADLVKEARDQRQAQIEAIRQEEDRAELLAEAQSVAQRSALESAAGRYDALNKDYMECREGLRQIRSVTYLLVDAFVAMLGQMRPDPDGATYTARYTLEEIAKAHVAIDEARRHLH